MSGNLRRLAEQVRGGMFTDIRLRTMRAAPPWYGLSRLCLMLLLLLTGLDGHALTLGRVQGAALIGRALDVTIQVQLDPDQSITSACFEADVFHGDTRQNPSRVRVRLEPTAAPLNFNLRVSSDSRVDEPIVTIYLRAGCAQMSSRRYVLLADFVSEQATPVVPRVAAVPLVDPSSTVTAPSANSRERPLASAADGLAAAARSAQATVTPAQPKARPSVRRTQTANSPPPGLAAPAPVAAPIAKAPAASPQRKSATPRSEPVKAQTPAAPVAASGQARLKLDPLESLSERVATLESTSAPLSTEEAERDAREAQRLERLEASVNSLLVLAQKNQASLLDVRNRLDKAQADRFSNPVIYVLFGSLLLCLLAIAYLLTRISRRPEPPESSWFGESLVPSPESTLQEAPIRDSELSALSVPAPLSQPAAIEATYQLPLEPTQPMVREFGSAHQSTANTQVDVSLVEMSASTFDRLMQSGASGNAVRAATDTLPMAVAKAKKVAPATVALASVPVKKRILSDELIDVRQRAEFFVTLGQTDQAVQALEAQIAQDGASSPQIYLDLFKLFHSLGLNADYDHLRGEFSRQFNSVLPEFSRFGAQGRSLEEYPGAVDRLIAAWGKPNGVDTVERLILRSPDQGSGALFDLAAFRDLLMLHAVARAVHANVSGRPSAIAAPLQQIDAAGQVDIDLSELFATDNASTMMLPHVGSYDATSMLPFSDSPQDNLIDFDLTEVGSYKKPGSDS